MQKPICLYDSGIGGLTVLKKLLDKFPNENYIYYADLANVPFGDKTKDEIKAIANSIIEWLSKFNPKLIIMACNTSSAILREKGKGERGKETCPVYGMIDFCAKKIAASSYKKVTVWATKLAVKNHGYKNAINETSPNIEVEEIACPKLVPIIENITASSVDRETTVKEYLEKTSQDTEALIWGCTHYPHIEREFKKLSNIKTIDPADSLIEEISNSFSLNKSTHQLQMYSSADTGKLEQFAKLYLFKAVTVKQITLKVQATSQYH